MSRSKELQDAKDFDGAYAVAAEAQRSNTSPQNYMAALMAGIAASRGERQQLAEEHLQFASSTDASNPVWVQCTAWEMLAFVKLRMANAQMSDIRPQGPDKSLEALANGFRRAFATMADADAAISMALDIATKAGDKDRADRYRVERAGLRRVRDNLNAMSELPLLLKAMREGGAAGEAAAERAMLSRIDSIFAAIGDLCEGCEDRRRTSD